MLEALIDERIQSQGVSNLDVGVVIPTFNEEKNVCAVIPQLKDCGYRNILVIDGLSNDNTAQVSIQNGAKVVVQTGRGKGQAIRQVLQSDYLAADVLVLMDGDGSMSSDEIHRFVKAVCDGADVAKGSRFLPTGGTYDMTRLRKFGNSVICSVTNLLHSSNYTDICYGFVALNKKAVMSLSQCLKSNGFDIEAEMFIKAKQLGLNVVEVPSVEYKRKSGKSNLHSFRDGVKIFWKIFSLALH